jgi:hypothetical protein
MQHHVVIVVVALPPLRFWGWEAMKFIIWFYRFHRGSQGQASCIWKKLEQPLNYPAWFMVCMTVLQGFLDVPAVPEQGLGYKEAATMNSTITEDGSVDFKGRPADKSTTGGWKTAPFIFATAMFEMIVNLGIAFNLNSYLSGPMHIPIKLASQYTTSYWGTSFITSLIGGFISDTYIGRFWTSVLAAVIELLVKSNKPIISLCCMSLLDTS